MMWKRNWWLSEGSRGPLVFGVQERLQELGAGGTSAQREAAAAEVRENAIEVHSATGRPFLIEFAPDPDIIIREEMEHQH